MEKINLVPIIATALYVIFCVFLTLCNKNLEK